MVYNARCIISSFVSSDSLLRPDQAGGAVLHTLLPADRPNHSRSRSGGQATTRCKQRSNDEEIEHTIPVKDRSLGNALASAIQASSSLRIIALPEDLLVGAALGCDAVGALLGTREDEGDSDDDGALLGTSEDEGDSDDDGVLLGTSEDEGDSDDDGDGALLVPSTGRAVGISDTDVRRCELVYEYIRVCYVVTCE